MNYRESFNATDVNPDAVKDRSMVEAIGISSDEKARRGRTFNQVLAACMMGHTAELYLIDNCDFIDDNRKFMDLLDPIGNEFDIKVSPRLDKYKPFVLDGMIDKQIMKKRSVTENWSFDFNVADNIIFYDFNNRTGVYAFDSEYQWNGIEYEEK